MKFINKEANIPYTYYFQVGKKYLIFTNSIYYNRYILANKSYTNTIIMSSYRLLYIISINFLY